MTDWNPSDPDAVRVHYDLEAWTFDQQGELAAALADAEIPHAWEGAELLVPEDVEQEVDLLIADVEARLGIVDPATPALDRGELDGPAPQPVLLAEDVPATEYDLDEWPPEDVQAVRHALAEAGIPFRWEEPVLLVSTEDEELVDDLLDEIEEGGVVGTDELVAAGDGDESASEALTTFFLAGERLRTDPLDPDGLEQLLAATADADAADAPFGVAPRLWQQTCGLADQLVDALTADEGPERDEAMALATQLHDLLRPYV